MAAISSYQSVRSSAPEYRRASTRSPSRATTSQFSPARRTRNSSALGTVYTEDSVHHIEMHPGNRVLFVFQDGHTEEHFWEDHSRKDSWDAEKRQKAAEKTRIQHQKRKEQEQ